ncbi:MAG TPA: APC family permease [Pseudonocardiaceae bacterium]
MTSQSAPVEGQLRRDVGKIGLLFAGVGSIIGSGWLFSALRAAHTAGPAAVISWAIATVMILLIGLCFAELGTMFPISGGVVRFPHLSFGSFASYTMGWITWLAAVSVPPIEVEAALQYATKYLPLTTKHLVEGESTYTLTGLGGVFAIVGMAVFVVLNYIGVKYFAQINNAAVWWKLAIIILVIAAFLVTVFHGENFSSFGFMPQGWGGVFTAIPTAGIVFSFLGFRQGVELAGETKNPSVNVPFAVIGSVLLCGVIYIALEIAFIGAVRPSDLMSSHGWKELAFADDFGPLAAIATILGLSWLATLLYIDAVISPADTGFAYTAVTTRVSYAMGKNRNAPHSLTKINRQGVPWISLVLTFIVGLIFFLPFPSWQSLVTFITSATVLSFGTGPLVLAALRRQLPDHERPFKLPGGDLIPFLAFYSSNMIIFWAGWTTNLKIGICIAIGFVLWPIFHYSSKGQAPHLDWKAGATWILPWLIGNGVISYLSVYDGTGLIGPEWGFLVNLIWSAIIYLTALSVRFSPQRVRQQVSETTAEAAEEEKELNKAY